MIGAILLATALHVPASHFGGCWWSEYLPVEPGKRYSFKLRREDPPDKPIWVKAFFYDEDRYPIGYGRYPKEVGKDYYFNHTWPVDFSRGAEIYTPMPEARYMRMLFTSEGAINVENWWFEECGTSSVVRVDRKYSPSAWCIVVPDRESEPIDFAAKELQHWMKEIGSERPGIVRGKAPAGKRAIYLGHDFIKDDTGRFDAWRVTKRGNDLFLASGRDEGVINAVFDLLERNTDLVFARADVNDGTVFTKTNGIRFENCEFHVEPAFEWREFGATGYAGSHLPSYLWDRRNFCNTRGGGTAMSKSSTAVVNQWFYDRRLFYEIGGLIPNEKYFKDHPEFYGFRRGERVPYEHYGVQPCYTCEAGRREMAKNLIARFRRDRVSAVGTVSLGFGDTWDLCRCPACIAPVTLPSGRVLKDGDDDFRSYQYYRFLTALKDEIAKELPGLRYETLGYLYAAVPPPELRLPSDLSVTFCPYPKICRVPVYDDEHNARWHARSEAWARSGATMRIYEYYGNAFGSARPACDIIQKDLVYWNGLGYRGGIYTEMCPDLCERSANGKSLSDNWDFGLMENWVTARLFVDPTRDVARLRADFCRRAYHEAALLMAQFFGTIREEWFKDPKPQGWREDPVASMNRYVRSKGREKAMRELLVRAEATAGHPNSKALVHRTLEQFDRLVARANVVAPATVEIPYKAKTFELKVGETRFKAWHDNHALQVAFDQPGEAQAVVPVPAGVERFPKGAAAGVVIRPGKDLNLYYHFLVTPDGVRYDAKGYDLYWNSDGFKATAKRTEKGWRGLLSIPLGDVGVNPTVPGDVYLNFVSAALQEDAHRTESFKPYRIEAK